MDSSDLSRDLSSKKLSPLASASDRVILRSITCAVSSARIPIGTTNETRRDETQPPFRHAPAPSEI